MASIFVFAETDLALLYHLCIFNLGLCSIVWKDFVVSFFLFTLTQTSNFRIAPSWETVFLFLRRSGRLFLVDAASGSCAGGGRFMLRGYLLFRSFLQRLYRTQMTSAQKGNTETSLWEMDNRGIIQRISWNTVPKRKFLSKQDIETRHFGVTWLADGTLTIWMSDNRWQR